MTAAPQEAYITVEEYEASEAKSPVKREYFQGRVYVIAGAAPEHNRVAFNASRFLGNRLGGADCWVPGSDQRVKIEASGFQAYPDLTVCCGDA